MEGLGVAPELIDLPPTTVHSARRCRREARLVYFHGHFDVVPAQRATNSVRGRDGRIMGRGTADMKGGLVSMLFGAPPRASSASWTTARIVLLSSATRRPAARPDPATCARPV